MPKADKTSFLLLLLRIIKIDIPEHHFIPRLIAPANRFQRIGVRGIGRRIVEVGGAFDPRTLRHEQRLIQAISVLPVEIVAVATAWCVYVALRRTLR